MNMFSHSPLTMTIKVRGANSDKESYFPKNTYFLNQLKKLVIQQPLHARWDQLELKYYPNLEEVEYRFYGKANKHGYNY